MDEKSAGSAPRHGRAEPCHERRRCARPDRVPHLAERRTQIGGRKEMIRHSRAIVTLLSAVVALSCSHKTASAPLPTPTAFGAAIVESSGGKQTAQTGTLLPQP